MEPLFVIALVLGLSSGLHCIGMCGPIALSVPVNRKSHRTLFQGLLIYNAGRILTYALLGAIVGMVGLSIQTLGLLQWTSIVSGLLLVVYAWRKYISIRVPFKWGSSLTMRIGRSIGMLMRSSSHFKLPALGMLNGLLPCGMVFVAMTNAGLTGTWTSGVIAMTLFGIGTLPALLAVGFFGQRISTNARMKFSRVAPYVLTLVGILVTLRGMNLDIPYISPKVTVNQSVASPDNDPEQKTTLEMSCCTHSKSCE